MKNIKITHLAIFSLLLFFVAGPAVASKSQAPVTIGGTAGATGSTVNVVFSKAGTNVEITVYGVRGLNGLKAQKQVLANVTAGQSVSVQSKYSAPENQGAVAVCVSGNFGGLKTVKTQSFRVSGSSESAGTKNSGGQLIKDGNGQMIIDTPAQVVK